MMLPTFSLLRQHSAAAKQICWEITTTDQVCFSGYTENDGTARDIIVFLPSGLAVDMGDSNRQARIL